MYTALILFLKGTVLVFVKKNWPYVLAATVAIALLLGAYRMGKADVQEDWDADKAKTAQYVLELESQQGRETVKVVTEYVDRIKIVTVKGQTIIEKVPVYVTKEDDARCGAISAGFVQLWNAANQNEVPGAP